MVAMAKAKEKEAAGRANPTRKNNLNNNNNNDRNKKNLENGLYVHSSPPKAINSNNGQGSATIRDYIRAGDIEALEEVVLQGQGTKLVNQHATDQKVRNFLKTVPSYMSKIDLIHDAVEKGNLRDLKALLDRRKLARSKDAQGVGLLHKAVVHDHRGIVDYLISDYPETLDVTDHEGRTPLHYCAASNFADDMYSTLSDAVADPQLEDNNGKTAADYMSNPRELNISKKNNKKGSGDSKGKRMTPPKRKSPAHKIRTPPKREGMTITGANIRIWIHDKDLTQLEKIVWEGQGHRLLGETSNNAKVRQFLNLVPRMMTKIKEVHQAAINGDLETLDAKADPTDILIAKDQNGLTPLHKSAALGLKDVSEWIVQKNHSTLFAQDNKGRTPLFYAGIAKDGGEVYDMLLRSGADKNHNDQYRRTADHYRFKPTDLDVSIIHETPVAPRGGGGSTLDIPSRSSGSKEGSRAPSRNGKSRNPSRRNSPGEDKKKHDKKNDKEIPKGVQDFKDMKSVSDDEIEAFIREGDLESLEYVILSGRGTDLQGKSSWNDETRRFLKRVPGYMEKITALHEAAASGNVTNVRRLVKENQKLVMARDKDGAVALHHAAKSGDPKVTKYVMSLYPEAVTLEDNDGRTPLHYAGMARGAGADEVFSLLEKEGARPDEADLSGNTPEDYRQSSSRSNLLTVDNHERGRTKTREGKKGKSNGPSRDPSKGPSKGPSRDPSKGPSRDPSKGPSKDPAKGPSKGPSKAPSREPSKSREKSKEPSKQNSKQASKQNSKQPSKQNSKQPSRQNSRQPSKERGSEPSKADKSKDPSRSNSKAPSRRGSRGSSPHAVVGGAKNNIEIIAAIAAAEKNDDYKPLNDIVIRGDGEKLIGQTSKDPEVNDYLKKIPESLDAIEELHSAVEAGETRKVMQLLDKKQKAQTRDGNHANILHKAVLHGHTDLVRYIISSFPELAKQEDLAGRTPLHYAAVLRDGGHIYKILEKEGGNPKAKDKSGHSPEEYKNDPKILTQWDLMKELEDGIGNSDAKGRPDTKESEAGTPTHDGENETKQIDPVALVSLEEEYEKFASTESRSLLKKYLTQEVFDDIKSRVTAGGATLHDCVRSGFANPDSHIGLYAPDTESYSCFNELFDPVINEYHGGFGPDDTHPGIDFGEPSELGDLNEFGDYVVSTRVRCARSVEGYPFNPLLTSEQYAELEQDIVYALEGLEDDLAGHYRPLHELTAEEQEELLGKHLLFKEGDRFLEAAGASRFWPGGRGIFLNSDDTLVVWVNEEDHLRIISMQEGGNLGEVYDRFVRAVTDLDKMLPFSFSKRLGFLTFCPTNLGTAIRASVHIRLPKLGENRQTLEETADKFNLQVRGTSGEHTEAEDGVFDISNRRRLGITEIEALQEMYNGVKEIIQLEQSLEESDTQNSPDGEDGSEQLDATASFLLEEEYKNFSNTESSSLLKRHLTPEIFDAIKDRTTALGATFYDCIKSGFANPDSHIGLYAPDAESYACFKELFDPVIDEYHGGFGPDDTHPTVDFGDPTTLGDLNAWGDYVVSTRVRCARSVEGYPFNPLLTSEQYTDLEQNVSNVLQTLEEDLAGNYRPISEISPEDQEELLEKHLLFKQGDRFLEAAGACRFWPEGRGIFLNGDNTLVIWVNEEDHLRIISMQEGGNLSEVYSRFVRAVTTLGEKLPFSSSEHLGFLSFCPTNLGTGIRASVHIRLPKLGEDMQTLEETANKYNLQVRGTSGEHSEAKGHVYDVSNRRRLGITEIEAIQEMYDGVKEIIQLEKSMEDGSNENNEEEGSEQDPAATISLDEEYEKFSNTESSSLLKKHLTPEIFDAIKDRTTSLGATLYDCIKSGFANPDSHIGLYAPDAESYACFKELFDPVIDEYHGGFGPDVTHPTVDFGDPTTLGDLNAWGDYVVSTRVRCARSVEGYPFNPLLTSEQYTDLEQNVSNALQTLEEDLAGNYRPISEISPEDQEELLEKHLLFKQGDRFLEAAGACRFWPEGRGIFLNGDNTLVIWVNEEDHMRIISMQEGGNLSEVYSRFVRAVTTLGEKLPFSSSEHLGFLSFCPTNLGTGIRASVHIRLPKLGEDMQTLEETANKYNLQVRGTSGEHSEAKGHVYDVSNRRRLGITEIEAIQEMYDGVKEIIQLEKSMEDSSNENTSNDTKADANLLSDRHKGMLSRRNSTISSKSEFPGMWSDEGQYLTKVLGDALVNALSEVNEARPKDPISYLACSLYNYRYSEKPDSPTNDSKSIGSTGSGGSGHSTIAMQTALDSTGGQQQTSPQTRDKNGQNVLHFAASRPHGRSAFYRLVAESGCNLADRDDQYRTPRDVAEDSDLQENVRAIDKWIINLAAEGKQKQLKKLLIDGYDHIADVDDDQGNNILNVAQNKGQGKTVDFLRGLAAFEEKRDWLHKAIRVGSLPHVQYIADSEDIARAKDVHSRTSLHIATLCEEKEIMEFLATQYPDLLKIGDNLERTPLHYAMAVEGVDQVAKVLVQAGARRAVKDLRGRTPSGSFIHPEIVRELQKEERKLTDPNIKPIPEEEPGVPEEEPGVPEEEPSVPEEEPGVPEEESGVPEEEKPVVPEEEPVVPEGDPGVPEEPVVA
ncbi:uncharacterized protein LOC135214834 isoform X8 [Macrobrachium nipponense]|uniref:uncharacterized protein LOC135214834 isoform X8 n=1 Tax=Macrobrachium nipponense TaxID=159736 RepID=UPI0030C89953